MINMLYNVNVNVLRKSSEINSTVNPLNYQNLARH